MKQVLGSICGGIGLSSLAAAGVMVATSAANAESRPLAFETEFDLNFAPTPTPAGIAAPDVTKWEQSIGAYLDGLLSADESAAATTAAVEAAAEPAGEEPAAAPEISVIEEDIKAFQPTETAVKADSVAAANPLLLAPILSHPMDCAECRAGAEEAAAAAPVVAPPVATVDDTAAWQKLAEWASARVAADRAADEFDEFDTFDVVTAESVFFEDADDDSATD